MASDTINARFFVASIVDAFAHTGVYTIAVPAGPTIGAVDLHQVGCVPLGARPLGMYPVRSDVLCCQFPDLGRAFIIGAVPASAGDAARMLPDSIVLRSCVGQFQDPMHYSSFTKRSLLGNHSAGRPADSLPGDWGQVNDLGLAVFIGRLMASLRASDGAKVEAFWGDDLLRLVGYNMELFTAGSEERRLNDEAEYVEVLRLTSYPWEAMGTAKPGDATTEAGGKLEPNSEDAKYEPKEDNQLIIPRYIRLRGYLGDVMKEFVCAPPKDLDTETYEKQTKYTGLLEVTKDINGGFSVRSAKGITFEKTLLIPIPKQLIEYADEVTMARALEGRREL